MKPQLGGIATYITELTAAIARRPGVEVCVATSASDTLGPPPSVDVIQLRASVRRFARRAIWRERRLRTLVRSWNASVLLAPTVDFPLRKPLVPSVMVVHDLGAMQEPQLYGRLRWLRFRVGIPLACRRADRVVCVSHATCAALTEAIPASVDACTVIGEAGRTLPERRRARRETPYVLNVGSMLRHKNLRTLVEAMSDPALGDADLIVAGPRRPRARAVRKLVRFDECGLRISHLGFITVEELANLYAGAAVVALPSLYEGFGLRFSRRCNVLPRRSRARSQRTARSAAVPRCTFTVRLIRTSGRALSSVIREPQLSESLSPGAMIGRVPSPGTGSRRRWSRSCERSSCNFESASRSAPGLTAV